MFKICMKDTADTIQSDLLSETVTGNQAYLGAYDRVIDRFDVSILNN